jgi:putative transposase
MKASKFSDARKALVLQQGEEGAPVADLCREAEIGPAASFARNTGYAGLLPDEMRRLRAPEDGNALPTKIAANLTLDRETPQGVIRRKL